MDLYLKFPDEETANGLLFTEEEPNYQNIDVLGILTEGGQWDEEGNEVVAPTVIDGWHVNIRLIEGEDAEPLLPYLVTPSNPRRVWA